jgi:DNA-binding transcriptional ArsR family regulator
MFRLLGEPSRLRILVALQDDPRCVGDIAAEAGLSASLVSHHLRLLRSAGLVEPERAGKHIFYRLGDEHVAGMLSDMLIHARECFD